jgi:hypothetical protein
MEGVADVDEHAIAGMQIRRDRKCEEEGGDQEETIETSGEKGEEMAPNRGEMRLRGLLRLVRSLSRR